MYHEITEETFWMLDKEHLAEMGIPDTAKIKVLNAILRKMKDNGAPDTIESIIEDIEKDLLCPPPMQEEGEGITNSSPMEFLDEQLWT